MKQGWTTKRLSELYKVQSSKRVHKSDWQTEGVPFYRAREVVKLSNYGFVNNDLFISEELFNEFSTLNGLPQNDDIIISAVGTLGKCYLVKDHDRFYFKDASVLWFAKVSDVYSRYIIYAFESNIVQEQVFNKSMGATVGTLTISRARNIKIPIPTLEEQKRIVAKLDQCFEAIDKARANIERNLQNAKDLFQSKLNEIFSQKGEGWVEKKIGEIVDLNRGQNPPKKDFVYSPKDGYVRFYQIRDGWSDKHAVFVPDSHKLHRVNPDEILMVAYRHVGRRFRGADGAFNVALCKLTNKNREVLDDDYLFHIIPTNYVRGELLKRSERSLIPSMSVTHLNNIIIPLPPIDQQKQIVEAINQLTVHVGKLTSAYKNELELIDELKKSILQEAFEGKLT